MRKVYLRIVRDDQQEFLADATYSGDADWGITAISGIDTAEFEVFTESRAVGDGDIVTGKRIKSREIEFTAIAKNSLLNAILRRAAIAFFNPKHTFKVYVTYQDVTLWINAELQAKSIPSEHIRNQQSVSISFFCADPYFKSVDEYGKDIASIENLWTFEELDDPDFGEPFDCYNFAKEVDITNDGDVETFCTIVITASSDVVNPVFYQGDAYIKINDTLHQNDILQIDVANRTIQKNGENIMVKIDRTSDFNSMQLSVGDNKISYDADDGALNMSVRVFFNKLYLGV